jgi:phosphopantetheinyl transferase (holo-ACP synthase)
VQAQHPGFNFNISHAGDVVLFAAERDCLVGVDVMPVELTAASDTVDSFLTLMDACFTPAEWRCIRAPQTEHARLRQFYRHWVLKEAYIKAVGVGLAHDLRAIECAVPPLRSDALPCGGAEPERVGVSVHGQPLHAWAFALFDLDAHYVAAVALGPLSDAAPELRSMLLPATGGSDPHRQQQQQQQQPFAPAAAGGPAVDAVDIVGGIAAPTPEELARRAARPFVWRRMDEVIQRLLQASDLAAEYE